MNKKAQFYLILTAFIVSAFLLISTSLTSFKETTQKNIEIPFSELPKVVASVETSVRNNLDLAFEMVEKTGEINYLTNGVSNLVSGQYLIQEGELGYFLDNFDLGIYNVSDLTILGPSSFEVGLPEAKILRTRDLGGRYSVEAKPGLGNLLIELADKSSAFDPSLNPYVYVVDENGNDIRDPSENTVIYLTYDYTSSMRATKNGDTYLLGEAARVYADENNEIIFRLSNMKQDHILTLNYPNVIYETNNYTKGQVVPIKENGEVLGLIMVGEVDTQNKYLDYILLNLQKKISGQEKRKVTFDPYPEEGLKDNEIYSNVYPETVEKGNKVVITSIIHNNLAAEISDRDLACNDRSGTTFEGNNFTDIEPFGFFISEPFIEKTYEIELTVLGAPGTTPIEMGYHKDIQLSVVSTPEIALKIEKYSESIEIPVGGSGDIWGSYIKVISIDGTSPYDVKIILKNPYLKLYDGDIIDYNDLPGLGDVYNVNVQNNGLFFGDLSDVVGKCYRFIDGNYKYVDLDGDNEYDYNETIILDSDLDGAYDSGEEIKGIPPVEGTSLTVFASDVYYVSDIPDVYESKDVIFKDVGSTSGTYDVNDLVIPTFYAGDFFVLENFLCFIESYDDVDNFFRVVPIYTKGEQKTFTPGSYRIFKGFDVSGNFDPEASKLVEFKYGGVGWNFHDVGVADNIYFNSSSTVYDSNATVDDGLVYSFFDGDTSEINEKDFYHFKNYDSVVNNKYKLWGYDVWAVIDPSDGTHPDQFNLNIWEYENSGTTFTIFNIREGDTFFVAGQGYKVLGIYIDANPDNNSIFFVPVHSYQFNIINSLYKEKTLSGSKIQRYASFLDIYEFYPEREGTYSFSIKYYYWADLNNDDIIDENEISIVTEEYTFIVI